MAFRNPAKIIKKYKGSQNRSRVFNVVPNSVINEDSLGNHSTLSAPLSHSDNANAGTNALKGHGTISQCALSADKPKLSGKKEDFTPWQIRVEAYLDNIDLVSVLTSPNPDPVKNKKLYLELINLVDNQSLQVISSTAKNDGKLAYEKLCNYYLGDNKARMITALRHLSKLRFNHGESIQQFICKCDTLRTTLKSFPSTQDLDLMLVTQASEALPESFSVFRTVIQAAPNYGDWDNFKTQLQNHDSIESNKQPQNNAVMNIQHQQDSTTIIKPRQNNHFKKFLNRSKPITCHKCFAKNDHLTKNCGKIMKSYSQNFQGSPSGHQKYSPYPKGRGKGAHFQSGPRPQNSWNHHGNTSPWNKQKQNKQGFKGKSNRWA